MGPTPPQQSVRAEGGAQAELAQTVAPAASSAKSESQAASPFLSRRAFLAELEQRLAGEPKAPFALLVIDLDGFHQINSTFGALAGDRVLHAVAGRIATIGAGAECFGRLGSDEFGVLVRGDGKDDRLERLAEALHAALDPPVLVAENRISVSASIGIARRHDCSSAEELLTLADGAMRAAKAESRRSFRIHSGKSGRGGAALVRDRRQLQEAIEGDELSLAFQPIFDARTGDLRSAEVLARWHHKTLGTIPPSEFVPLAEQSGLILDLGWWVLNSAVRVLSRQPNLCLAVNVSPLQFRGYGFALKVQDLLHAHKVLPNRLEIEVTEGALISNTDIAERTLRQLRAVGIKVALDDFGTGYSSLGYLQRLEFDKLKLDQSFVRELANKPNASCLIRAIIDLGHSLGMVIVAEGVETRMHASQLGMLGCDLMQGYALGAPLPEAEFVSRYLSKPDVQHDVAPVGSADASGPEKERSHEWELSGPGAAIRG